MISKRKKLSWIIVAIFLLNVVLPGIFQPMAAADTGSGGGEGIFLPYEEVDVFATVFANEPAFTINWIDVQVPETMGDAVPTINLYDQSNNLAAQSSTLANHNVNTYEGYHYHMIDGITMVCTGTYSNGLPAGEYQLKAVLGEEESNAVLVEAVNGPMLAGSVEPYWVAAGSQSPKLILRGFKLQEHIGGLSASLSSVSYDEFFNEILTPVNLNDTPVLTMLSPDPKVQNLERMEVGFDIASPGLATGHYRILMNYNDNPAIIVDGGVLDFTVTGQPFITRTDSSSYQPEDTVQLHGDNLSGKTFKIFMYPVGSSPGDPVATDVQPVNAEGGGQYLAFDIPAQTQAGDYLVYAVDFEANQAVMGNLLFSIDAATLPDLAITTTSLPAATVGQPYSTMVATSGAQEAPAFTWEAAPGSQLPPGLSLANAAIPMNAIISGIPTTAGEFNFIITATVGEASASQAYTLTVQPSGGSSGGPAPTVWLNTTSYETGQPWSTGYIRASVANGYMHLGVNVENVSFTSGTFQVEYDPAIINDPTWADPPRSGLTARTLNCWDRDGKRVAQVDFAGPINIGIASSDPYSSDWPTLFELQFTAKQEGTLALSLWEANKPGANPANCFLDLFDNDGIIQCGPKEYNDDPYLFTFTDKANVHYYFDYYFNNPLTEGKIFALFADQTKQDLEVTADVYGGYMFDEVPEATGYTIEIPGYYPEEPRAYHTVSGISPAALGSMPHMINSTTEDIVLSIFDANIGQSFNAADFSAQIYYAGENSQLQPLVGKTLTFQPGVDNDQINMTIAGGLQLMGSNLFQDYNIYLYKQGTLLGRVYMMVQPAPLPPMLHFQGYKNMEPVGGGVASNATGHSDPWFGSIAYKNLNSRHSIDAQYHAGTGVQIQGFDSLPGPAGNYVFDFYGYQLGVNNPNFITDTEAGDFGHEYRNYDGNATWIMYDISGPVPVEVASGTMSALNMDIFYDLQIGATGPGPNASITGESELTVNPAGAGSFYDELMTKYNTNLLYVDHNSTSPIIQAENPNDDLYEQYAYYDFDITVTPGDPISNEDQAAPIGLQGIAPTSSANDDGQIIGVDATMEYRASGETEYTGVSGTVITGLPAGIYQVRYAARTGFNASLPVDVEVPPYEPPTPDFDEATLTYTIYNASELAWLANEVNSGKNDFAGYTVVLGDNIDLSAYDNWIPIGADLTKTFSGTFDGNGKNITNLKIGTADNPDMVMISLGLFGWISEAVIRDVGVKDVAIYSSKDDVYAGGLVGHAVNSNITESWVSGILTAGDTAIDYTYIGGLIGYSDSMTISNCYASVDVTGGYNVAIGGLVGFNYKDDLAAITNCYSTGQVTGGSQSYAGGLIGIGARNITSCYYDMETSGQADNTKGAPLSTTDMKKQASYVGWDFSETWQIAEGQSYPILQWQTPDNDVPLVEIPMSPTYIQQGLTNVLVILYEPEDLPGLWTANDSLLVEFGKYNPETDRSENITPIANPTIADDQISFQLPDQLPEGYYLIRVSRNNTGIAYTQFMVTDMSSIQGTVRDSSGNGLSGITVEANSVDSWESFPLGLGWGNTVETAADGTYQLPIPAGTYKVSARGNSENWWAGQYYLTDISGNPIGTIFREDAQSVDVAAFSPTTGIDFNLVQGGTISGIVTEFGTGNAVPHAMANPFLITGDRHDIIEIGQCRTDANGQYVIGPLPAGVYGVSMDTWDTGHERECYNDKPIHYQYENVDALDPINVIAGQNHSGIDFVLQPAGTMSGTVTDSSSRPVANVRVEAYDTDNQYISAGYSNAEGYYEIRCLPLDGQLKIQASPSNDGLPYLDQWYSGKTVPDEADPVSFAPGTNQQPDINFVLQGASHGEAEFLQANPNHRDPDYDPVSITVEQQFQQVWEADETLKVQIILWNETQPVSGFEDLGVNAVTDYALTFNLPAGLGEGVYRVVIYRADTLIANSRIQIGGTWVTPFELTSGYNATSMTVNQVDSAFWSAGQDLTINILQHTAVGVITPTGFESPINIPGATVTDTEFSFILSPGLDPGDYSVEISRGADYITGTPFKVIEPLSSEARLSDLSMNGTTLNGFSPDIYLYDVELPAGTTIVPSLSYSLYDSRATAVYTAASMLPGSSTIQVTAQDGTQKTYTVNFNVAGDNYIEYEINPPRISGPVGSTVVVPIGIKALPENITGSITTFGIIVNYDPQILRVTGAEPGSIGQAEDLDSNYSLDPDNFNNQEGKVVISYSTTGTGITQSGIFYNISFEILAEPANNETAITLGPRIIPDGAAFDEGNHQYPALYNGGIISTLIYGDVNGDGLLNGLDLVNMKKYFAGISVSGFNTAAANVNADADLNGLDLVLMRKYFAGLPVHFGPQ